jgi:hypothetical protein
MTNAKLPKEQFPFGACPLMSTVHVQSSPLALNPGIVDLTRGSGVGPNVLSIPIPCLGADCQLWHDVHKMCDLGPAREVWTHERNLPNGALTGKSGADWSLEIVKALRSLQLVLEMLHKKLK